MAASDDDQACEPSADSQARSGEPVWHSFSSSREVDHEVVPFQTARMIRGSKFLFPLVLNFTCYSKKKHSLWTCIAQKIT